MVTYISSLNYLSLFLMSFTGVSLNIRVTDPKAGDSILKAVVVQEMVAVKGRIGPVNRRRS